MLCFSFKHSDGTKKLKIEQPLRMHKSVCGVNLCWTFLYRTGSCFIIQFSCFLVQWWTRNICNRDNLCSTPIVYLIKFHESIWPFVVSAVRLFLDRQSQPLFCLFPFYFEQKFVNFSGIWSQIVGIEGKHADQYAGWY